MGEYKNNKIKIDGIQMVEDLYGLFHMNKRDLPKHINRNWHPEIKKIYLRMLSGEYRAPYNLVSWETNYDVDNPSYYIYELDPIDDWSGYHQIYLEDLLTSKGWLEIIAKNLECLRRYTGWEHDIREGLYVSMLPGKEWSFSPFAVLLKQDNNGTTYCVSKQKFDHIKEFLIAAVK